MRRGCVTRSALLDTTSRIHTLTYASGSGSKPQGFGFSRRNLYIHSVSVLSAGHLFCPAGCMEMTDTEFWATKWSQLMQQREWVSKGLMGISWEEDEDISDRGEAHAELQ